MSPFIKAKQIAVSGFKQMTYVRFPIVAAIGIFCLKSSLSVDGNV